MENQKRDLLILSIGKVVQVLVGLISLRLLTEMLSEDQVGIYYILQTFISLIAFGFLNPIGQFYGRHLIKWEQAGTLKTATNTLIFLRGLALPFAIVFSISIFYIFQYEEYFSLKGFILFNIIAVLATTHGVLLNAANVIIGRITFTVILVSTLSIGIIISILFIQISPTAMAWIYGLSISQIIFSFILYMYLVRKQNFSLTKLRSAFSVEYVKYVLVFIAPVTVTLFLQWGQTVSFRLVVEDLYSIEILGFIAVGMAVSGAIFSAIESLSSQFYMPIYLRRITNENKISRELAWNDMANIILPIYISLTIYVIIFAPYLLKLLVSDKFFDAYIYTMIGAIIECFRVYTNLVYTISQSEVKTKTTITPYLIGFIIMVTCMYSVDAVEALWKVPATLACSYLVTALFMTYNMKKLLDVKVPLWAVGKIILLMSPLTLTILWQIDRTFIKSVMLLIFGCGYMIIINYFVLRQRIMKLSQA